MKTNKGWFYHCRDCFGFHLIPYAELSEDSKQRVEVYIKCPNKKERNMAASVYERKDFVRWSGDDWVYNKDVVEPTRIKKIK